MDRRTFLKWQMQGVLLAGVAPGLLCSAGDALAAAPAFPDIAVAKGSPATATRAAVQAVGGMGRFVKPGQRVVIKPNMSFANTPESATNTHPDVVREVLAMVKEAGAASVRVLDHSLQNPEQTLIRSGIRDACNSIEEGICHHLMDAKFYRDTQMLDGKEMKSNAVMTDVLAADVIIAVPVAKHHGGAGVSLSLKGQMGLIYDRHSMHSRYDLQTSIVDLFTRLRPALAVIDATRVLTTRGPSGPGEVITPGEVIASADPVAADAMAVASYQWYGKKLEPRQVGHIRIAHERGLGRMDVENLVVKRVSA
ncbi:conserved exported hypothetical protein [uncultured delta proteobacterium]|uniref:DUF362 domain-containing protein n=1 Tax=uncultured delta proteobacterium TaxID=34034 RepID=A0A212JZY8_9DELT|nr:conserved exported hypothetical protein [uncultured delta proteobacterium]